MKAKYLLTTLILTLIWNIGFGQDPWINEIHYDNDGADYNEGVEIAGLAGTDLSCYTIYLYNGNDGATYHTEILSGTIPDEGCGYGAIWFPISGIQNGAPDGLVLYDFCNSTVLLFLSYEGSFTATNGVANGMTSTDIGVSEADSPSYDDNSLQLTGSGTQYSDFSWAASSPEDHDALNPGQSISPCGGGPPATTLSTDALSSLSFSVDCSTDDTGTVDFSSTGSFNSGNTYTVELSDASGSFTSPTEIGSLTSTANSGTINISIPAGTPSGGGYRVRIVADNPSTTSPENGSDIVITLTGSCTPPHISSIIINSCQFGGCSEGHNEIVFGNTGDYSLDVSASNVDFYYQGVYPPTDNYTESLTTNTATTTDLNTAAGCPGLFVEGVNEIIPPDASFMIVRSTICPGALDWASLCGSGPIYVIYTTDATWQTSGNFNNSADGMRYFRFETTTTGGESHSVEYEYNSDDLTLHSDGDYVTFPATGGAATAYDNNGCSLEVAVLGTELTRLWANYLDPEVELKWVTDSEINNDYFKIEHSVNAQNWATIQTLDGSGTTDIEMEYSILHDTPAPGINYYKLTSYDFDGREHNKGIVSVETDFNFVYYNSVDGTLNLSYETDFEVVTTDGKIVSSASNTTKIDFANHGFYFVRDLKNQTVQRIFVP